MIGGSHTSRAGSYGLCIDPVHQRRHKHPLSSVGSVDSASWRSPHVLSMGVPQSYITRLSIYRRITLRVGRKVSVTGGGGKLACSHVSTHKRSLWSRFGRAEGICLPHTKNSQCVLWFSFTGFNFKVFFFHVPGRGSGSEIYLSDVNFYLPRHKLFYFFSGQQVTTKTNNLSCSCACGNLAIHSWSFHIHIL